MGHYLSDVRDLEFNLFEVLKVQDWAEGDRGDVASGDEAGSDEAGSDEAGGEMAGVDEATVREVLGALDRLASGPLADSFADREVPVFDAVTGSARVPDAMKKAYRALRDGGWHRLWLPEELGGVWVPASVRWAAAELLLGANPALYLYFSAGPACAALLYRLGTGVQRRWAELMVERDWGATMVITEPDAGSDVGAARTTATRQPDGSWRLDGVKRFITAGDQDLTENIVHLVLARPVEPGPPPAHDSANGSAHGSAAGRAAGSAQGDAGAVRGVKGLSVFVVPKFLFDPRTGALGERNGVFATHLEDKMGLRGSATCELTFGGPRGPARGWLLGDAHDGIAQMFQAIEWARMTVGAKAIATLSTGYRNAVVYARTRVQGPDLRNVLDKTTPRVAIVEHPDVRRMLMLQKAYAEGLRALLLFTADVDDGVQACEAEFGTQATPEVTSELMSEVMPELSPELAAALASVRDLLLPVVKGVSAERSYEQLALSLQVFGGSGFLRDYPIEQYLRDAKIDSLYEGTTGIQSLDFFLRKIVRDDGLAWTRLLDMLLNKMLDAVELHEAGLNGHAHGRFDGRFGGRRSTHARSGQEDRLGEERWLFASAVYDVCATVEAMRGFVAAAVTDPRELWKAGQHTVRLLLAVGDVLVGGVLLWQALVALAALDTGPPAADRRFYEGKVAVASFFARTVLPGLATVRRVVEAAENGLMDVSADAF